MLEAIVTVLQFAGVIGCGSLFGGNLYEAMVTVPNWRAVGGVAAFRAYSVGANPGHFFRVVSPVTNLVLIALAALSWNSPRFVPAIVAALATISAELFTFAYFFPRNRIIGGEGKAPEAARAVEEWSRANWLRLAMVLVGTISLLTTIRR